VENDLLTVRLNAPAVEGRANEALVTLLAKALGVAKTKIEIVTGEKGRVKKVRVEGLTAREVASRLDISL